MAWNEWVLLGIGIVINIAFFIFNLWYMARSASRYNAWQEGFNLGLEQGKLAERSKQRVWADEESEGADDD